jgi:hypothetical protein
MNRIAIGATLASSLVVFVLAAGGQEPQARVPAQASAGDKYSHLLRTLNVPDDEATYGELYDYGYYSGAEYAGHTDLPAGFWVYVSPNWYIWEKGSDEAGPTEPEKGAAPAVGRWEYKVVTVFDLAGEERGVLPDAKDPNRRQREGLERGLNALGAQGWDLVLAEPAQYVFKRPVAAR